MDRNDTETKNFERLGGLSSKFTKMVPKLIIWPLQAFGCKRPFKDPLHSFSSERFFLGLPGLPNRHLPMIYVLLSDLYKGCDFIYIV